MNNNLPPEVEALLSYFPAIDPPLTLSEEVAYKFSANNKPLPQALVAEFFSKWEELDEYSELVPCVQLAFEQPFYAIIYWKGALLSYEYILVTLKESGEIIAKKVIAGTISNGETIKTSVATIDEDGCVYSMVGEKKADSQEIDPNNHSAYRFEILPDGNINASKEALTLE